MSATAAIAANAKRGDPAIQEVRPTDPLLPEAILPPVLRGKLPGKGETERKEMPAGSANAKRYNSPLRRLPSKIIWPTIRAIKGEETGATISAGRIQVEPGTGEVPALPRVPE